MSKEQGAKSMPKNTKRSKLKKRLGIIFGIILSIVAIVAIIISVIAGKNVKVMNDTIDSAMAELKKHYSIKKLDAGEYEKLTLYGIMKFDVSQYYIEELGNLSVMSVNVGVMQMSTFVITPFDKNMPLLSVDYMYMLGNRICYVEFYDLVEEKDDAYNSLMSDLKKIADDYKYLDDAKVSEAWYSNLQTIGYYKGVGSEYDTDIKNMFMDSLDVYFTHAKKMPELTDEEKETKLNITVEYSNNLVDKGGISTDVFKSALGADETKRFFAKTFFGTDVKE